MFKQIATQKIVSGCKHVLKVGLFGLYAALTLSTSKSFAEPITKLENWRFYPESQQLEVMLSGSSVPNYFYLPQPPRIVVDLPDTKLGYVPTQQNFYGTIQSIRVSQFDENVTRIVMDLAPGAFFDASQMQLQPISRRNSAGWVLRPFLTGNYNSRGQGDYPPALPNNNPSPYTPSPYNSQPQIPNIPVDIPSNNQPHLPPGISQPGLGNLPPLRNPSYDNESYNQQQRSLPSNLPGDLPGNLPGDLPHTPPPQPQLPPNAPQQGLGTLPPVNNQIYQQQQQPFSVPPISPNNTYPNNKFPSPSNSAFPPGRFPTQPGRENLNNRPNVVVPNFPTPNIPNNFNDSNSSNIIEFGQPVPK